MAVLLAELAVLGTAFLAWQGRRSLLRGYPGRSPRRSVCLLDNRNALRPAVLSELRPRPTAGDSVADPRLWGDYVGQLSAIMTPLVVCFTCKVLLLLLA